MILDGFGKQKRLTKWSKSKDAGRNRRRSRDRIWSVGSSGAAEHATVDFALTVFQVDQVASAVQVVHFTLCNGRDAKGAGDFADRSKHRFVLGSFSSSVGLKIMLRRTRHQRQELKPAMRQTHDEGAEVYDLGKIVIKTKAV
ncbi:MAG: hypothetical protein ABS40_07875 [Agrobacterium sp. SCN 61-19]|nr:MAG: hypothetical protein ABS40_07875 [Agrobacterium sp. SCN 61-19]